MRAVWLVGRTEIRRRWRSIVVLTLLVAFAGCVVLALYEGARRTESSLGALRGRQPLGRARGRRGHRHRRTAPGLRDARRASPTSPRSGSSRSFVDGQFLPTAAQVDDRFGRVVDRPRVVEGRRGRSRRGRRAEHRREPGRAAEPEGGRHAGRSNRSAPPTSRAPSRRLEPHGPRVTFRIVGIVRRPLDLGGRGSAGGVVVPTPAFLDRYRDEIGSFSGDVLRVRTVRGAEDVARVSRAARKIFGSSRFFSFTSLGVEGQAAQDAVDVTTAGLSLAAAVALLTALIGIGIALSREVALGDAQQLTLSALGMRPRHRTVRGGCDRRARSHSSVRRSRWWARSWPRPSSPSASPRRRNPIPASASTRSRSVSAGSRSRLRCWRSRWSPAPVPRAPRGRSGCPPLPRCRRG